METFMLKNIYAPLGLSIALLASSPAFATIVQFDTVLGPFEVNLYDQDTPATVANFLSYVNAGSYDNVVIHRSAANFVVQGGGFSSTGALPLLGVPANSAVINEPEFSSVRGTIAMAKLGGDPNSATNQWFFNLGNNSANLDVQNGGFTVFGEVTGTGMTVVDAIAALPVFNLGGATDSIPLRSYSALDLTNNVPITDNHLVLITRIVVLDGAADTAAGLTPVPNTLINTPPPAPPAPPSSGGGGGGGATTWAMLLLLGSLSLIRRRRQTSR
jgi:peptidyl-prolyl cis-trans isomerase A (cyclophilin A)